MPGASGGVKFFVKVSHEKAVPFINELCDLIANPDRLLPGGYLYLTDILGNPQVVQKAGRIIASAYTDAKIDVVMTVATKEFHLPML